MPDREWAAAIEALRCRLDLPATVHAGTGDRRLRLSLDNPMDLAVLRAHMNTARDDVVVSEAPSALDHGWCGGRAHEVVILVVSTRAPSRPPAVLDVAGPLPMVGRDHGRMPGSQILYARLFGHPDLHDTILTRYLPALLSAWDPGLPWWFVRYRDPDPHLRLRFRLPAVRDYGRAASRVGPWAAGLIGDLTLVTYHPPGCGRR